MYRAIETEESNTEISRNGKPQGAKGKPHIYYLVLMDCRDYAFTVSLFSNLFFISLYYYSPFPYSRKRI